jgi:hypothetical protein
VGVQLSIASPAFTQSHARPRALASRGRLLALEGKFKEARQSYEASGDAVRDVAMLADVTTATRLLTNA